MKIFMVVAAIILGSALAAYYYWEQTQPEPKAVEVTALPPPNDYQADCHSENPPCTATASELRGAIDALESKLEDTRTERKALPGPETAEAPRKPRGSSPVPIIPLKRDE